MKQLELIDIAIKETEEKLQNNVIKKDFFKF